MKTARQELSEVLRFHREQRSLTIRRVADMCCTSSEAVANWEAGHVVPDGKAWDKLKGIVNKRLVTYASLRQRALAEAGAERDLIIRSMEHRSMATTNGANGTHPSKPTSPPGPMLRQNLGDKIANIRQAIPLVVVRDEKPADATANTGSLGVSSELRSQRTREALAKLPRGWKTEESRAKRKAFALEVLRQRPNIAASGADSLEDLLVKTFGVGLAAKTVNALREQAHAEHSAGKPQAAPTVIEQMAATPRPAEPLTYRAPPVPVPQPKAPPVANTAGNLEAAVQLILEAVPGLRTFTIAVDDHGEAAIDYTVREVKVVESGGSLKVRR